MAATTLEEMQGMSDEDFLNMVAPETVEPEKSPEELAAEEAARSQAEADAEAQRVADEAAVVLAEADPVAATDVEDPEPEDEDKTPPVVPGSTEVKPEAKEQTPEQLAAEAEAKAKQPEQVTQPVNYQEAYQKIMAPFKANGKTMEVKSPEEAIQLMQMGANYTRKMQELQPHRKTLMMLENNGLMDPAKLSYLIDLEKGNPEAIKKLLKDSKFDVLSVNLDEESTYQQGNHAVSDDEVNFKTTVRELNSNATGTETLNVINQTWDQASKEVLWTNPDVMVHIHQQRESGVYARITSEVERRRTLGQIQPGVPFLQAYKLVGDEMQAAGSFNDLLKPKVNKPPVAPVATGVVLPKPKPTDSKVAAAAVNRGAPGKATTPKAIFDMSDEEFMNLPVPK